MVHEGPRLGEPDRPVAAGPEPVGHEVNGPAMEGRIGGAVALVMAVVVVDESRVTAAPGGVAAAVVVRAWGERVQQRLAALGARHDGSAAPSPECTDARRRTPPGP
jgi:hypothetical protein